MDADKASSSHFKNILFTIAAITLLVFIFSILGLSLTKVDEQQSPLWFSSAILLAALFMLPTVWWPVLLVSCILALAMANFLSSTLVIHLPLTGFILAEAALGAGLLRRFLNPRDPLDSIYSWIRFFLIGVVLIPLLGALTAAYFYNVSPLQFSPYIFHWFSSAGIGILTLTPVGILSQQQNWKQMLKHKSLVEMIVMVLFTLTISFFAIEFLPFPFIFVVPPLLIGAVRLPRFEAFGFFLIVIMVLFLSLSSGILKLNLLNMADPDLSPQMPLLLILIPAHAMAMAMYAIRAERSNILQSETRFRNAMEYATIGMALVSLEGTWMQVNKSLCRFLKYTPRQLERLTFQEITHRDDLTSDLEQLNDLVSGRIDSYSREKRYIRSDGEIVWALLAVSLVRDEQNIPLYFISQIEDITEIKASESINKRLMERIQLANEAGGLGIWEWDIAANTMNWDKRMAEIYALPPGKVPSYDYWLGSIIAEDHNRAKGYFDDALQDRQPFSFEFRIHKPDDDIRHIRIYANVLVDENNQVVRMLGINQDVTSEARLTDALHEEKERLHITLDSIGDAVISVDKEMCVIFMNPVAENMTGWSQEEAQGKHIDAIMHLTLGNNGPAITTLLQTELKPQRKASALNQSIVLHSRKGQFFDIQHNCTPLKDMQGSILGAVLVIQDVSESRHLMQQLSYNALHDELTGLPNRANFAQNLEQALQTAIEQKRKHALVFIDLDRFKEVNDRAGHAAGDALLLELGLLMQKNIRQFDCLARLGGDEFGMILPDCALKDAQILVQRIIGSINDYPFYWDNKLYTVGGSAGITAITDHNYRIKEVMAQADIACYTAKHSGRGQVIIYESWLKHPEKIIGRKREFDRDHTLAMLENNKLVIMAVPVAPPHLPQSVSFYQLSVAAGPQENQIIGQDEFRLLAQNYDLLLQLDRWLINQILGVYGSAVAEKGLTLAIPLSLATLGDKTLVTEIITIISQSPAHTSATPLIISLDGAHFIEQYAAIEASVKQLRQQGCKIILDQFGDNFTAFKQLPFGVIDYVRLPNRFVQTLHSNPLDEMMATIINGHIHRLNARSVAGPVDLPSLLNKLSHLEIDLAEGESISHAIPLISLLDNDLLRAY